MKNNLRCILFTLPLLLSFLTTCGGATWEWDAIAPGGAAPSARAGASLTLLGGAEAEGGPRKLVLCGGQGADRLEVSGCARLDPAAGWSFAQVLAKGQTAYRSDHAAAVVAGAGASSWLLLYGGVNATPVSEPLPAPLPPPLRTPPSPPLRVVAFAAAGCEIIDTSTWQPAPAAFDCDVRHAPVARYAHSAALLGSAWLIFGGIASAGNTVLNDGVRPLDVSRVPNVTWGPRLFPAASERPAARAYHAAAAFGAQMIIFGGQGDTQGLTLFSDVWLLGPVASVADLANAVWVQRSASDGAGAVGVGAGAGRPLRGHRLELTGSLLLAYGGQGAAPPGGLMTLDLGAPGSDWAVPTVTGAGAGAPFRAAVALLDADGEADPELIVFGGAATSGAVSSGLAVLREVVGPDNDLASAANLPVILGGGGAALALLGALALAGYLRGRGAGAGAGAGAGPGVALFEQGRRAGEVRSEGSALLADAYGGAPGAGGSRALSPVTGYRDARRFRSPGSDRKTAAAAAEDEEDDESLRF
jgi:hypothetical protein